jgi:dipeptidyl aminopeptidase/acylaminoacyl peptidase
MTGDFSAGRRVPRTAIAVAAIVILAGAGAAVPQQKPIATIDEDCTAFRFARDGRVAFAVHHVFKEHKFVIQRDDFWIGEPGKGKHRILDGKLMARGEGGFSYTVNSLRWSPDGSKLTAELVTSAMEERHGNSRQAGMSFLLDANGHEIKITEGDSLIPDTIDAAWLDDESTVVYLEDEGRSHERFAMYSVRPAAGHAERLFPSTAFLAVAWMERTRQAVAVEAPDRGEKPRLVLLDLAKQTQKELAVLGGYAGGLSLSPSAQRVAYFRDPETLEARKLDQPSAVQSVRELQGTFYWAADEQHVVLKSGPERRSAIIELVRLSDGESEDLLHALTFWNFVVSPDGRRIGVSPPGIHIIEVYDLP